MKKPRGSALLALLLVLAMLVTMVPAAWVLLVGGLWMVQVMTYQCMAYHLDHGKKRR